MWVIKFIHISCGKVTKKGTFTVTYHNVNISRIYTRDWFILRKNDSILKQRKFSIRILRNTSTHFNSLLEEVFFLYLDLTLTGKMELNLLILYYGLENIFFCCCLLSASHHRTSLLMYHHHYIRYYWSLPVTYIIAHNIPKNTSLVWQSSIQWTKFTSINWLLRSMPSRLF